MLARHGGLAKHQHQIEGINSRLDGMQAAILSAKAAAFAGWTSARQAAAKSMMPVSTRSRKSSCPEVAADRTHVYHLYTISIRAATSWRRI